MIDLLSFKENVLNGIKMLPEYWRYGQKVFNYIDINYGIARDVQFLDNIDCFYSDFHVDAFINAAWLRLPAEVKLPSIVKIDIDGVLRDVVSEMCKIYNEKTDSQISPEDVVEYDCRKIFTKIDDPRRFFFYENADRIFGQSSVFEGTKIAIDRLRTCGFKIVLATYQYTVEAKKLTLDWLAKHEINYDSILFTNTVDKSDVVADYVIDDCPEILEKEKRDGVVRVCIDRPYNRSVDNSEVRVKSLIDLTEHYFYLVNNGSKKEGNGKTEEDRNRVGCVESNSGAIDND